MIKKQKIDNLNKIKTKIKENQKNKEINKEINNNIIIKKHKINKENQKDKEMIDLNTIGTKDKLLFKHQCLKPRKNYSLNLIKLNLNKQLKN